MKQKITLASGSAVRAAILRNAQIPFDIARPDVDEDALKVGWTGSNDGLAKALADAKCMAIANKTSGLVIGSDQILEFEGAPFDKPKSMKEAGERLLQMSGKTHFLINAISVAKDGDIIWRGLERPSLHMRSLTVCEIDEYLQAAGDDVLSSVGAYQIENLGARLFNKIDGDYFSVLGLSLFALLKVLRDEGGIDF